MKRINLVLAVMLFGLAGFANAWTGHGHGHARNDVQFRVVIGPLWSSWAYPPPYYFHPHHYRPVVIERYDPPVYIERQAPPRPAPTPSTAAAPAPAPQTNYWYYCAASKAYYPYVQECPSGWQKVLPHPAGLP